MRQFSSLVKGISRTLDKIAGAFIVVVMLLVVSNVVLRGIFNHPIKGTYELVGLLTAVAVSMGLAYCALQKGHIAVGFVVEYFPKKIQLIIDILNHFAALCFWSFTTWFLIQYGHTMMKKGLVTATAEIPVYPFVYFISCGFLVLCLVLMIALKEDVTRISKESFIRLKRAEALSEESI